MQDVLTPGEDDTTNGALLGFYHDHHFVPQRFHKGMPGQALVRQRYNSKIVQIMVAVLIASNFVWSAAEAQLAKSGNGGGVHGTQGHKDLFRVAEIFHTVLFTLELVWNLYAHWLEPFFTGPDCGWNLFDLTTVTVSLVSLMINDVPGISVLRLLRAFRVLRILKRVDSLRSIVEGVVHALPGVYNAFAILIIFMGIWSVIGVEFFREHAPDHYGNAGMATFTMFQMLTGDAWASNVTRSLVFDNGLYMAPIHSISFMFIAGTVISNVVVAILLEKYLLGLKMTQMKRLREHKVRERQKAEAAKAKLKMKMDVDLSFDDVEIDVIGSKADGTTANCSLGFGSPEDEEGWEYLNFLKRDWRQNLHAVINMELPKQQMVKKVYEFEQIQIFVALMILLNFLGIFTQAKVLPEKGSKEEDLFNTLEMIFNALFTVEVVVNLYGNWFGEFFYGRDSGWNVFDLLIVIMSWSLKGVSILRLFRAFRVIRLFKRVESLRIITESILACLPRVLQTFAILLLLVSIWAILGVQFYSDVTYEQFGSFFKGFLTMWQVMTCDAWATGDHMGRYIIYEKGNWEAAIFYATFIFAATIIMSNVVITVLLEGYLTCADRANRQSRERRTAGEQDRAMVAMQHNPRRNSKFGDESDNRKRRRDSETAAQLKVKEFTAFRFKEDMSVIINSLKDPAAEQLIDNELMHKMVKALKMDKTIKKVMHHYLYEEMEGNASTMLKSWLKHDAPEYPQEGISLEEDAKASAGMTEKENYENTADTRGESPNKNHAQEDAML